MKIHLRPLALLALTALAPAQTPTLSLAHLDEVLATWVDREKVAGVVALVEHRGEVVYAGAIRARDLASEAPMAMDTIFRIYSMTKPVTVVAALTLYDDGVLGLDDPVSQYLPAFADVEVGVPETDPETGEVSVRRVPAERAMTVRDLMRHTSGLTYGVFGTDPVDKLVAAIDPLDPHRSLEDLCDALAELPLKHQPGRTVEYGLSVDVLGRIVEVVSGVPLDAFMSERIFEPLGMDETGFRIAPDQVDRLATLYRMERAELVALPAPGLHPDPTARPTLFTGGAGLYSTTGDYLRFARMLLRGGELDGVRILREATVDEMCSNQLDREDITLSGAAAVLARSGFGLGGAVVSPAVARKGGPGAGTYSWGGAAGTSFWVDRENELTGVFMIQSWFDGVYLQLFQNEVYRALPR